MNESLDNILSGREPVSETSNEAVEPVVAQSEMPNGDGADTQVGDAQEPVAGEGEPSGQKMVPHEALHAERQKVKRYTEQVADFQKQLSETNAAWERRMAELVEAVKPKQEPQQQPDWWADPDAVLNQRLGQTINPLAQTVSQIQAQLFNLNAMQTHGAEKVNALKEFVRDLQAKNDPEIAIIEAQMNASPDPIKAGLEWMERRTFDPAAERERIKAELLAEIQPQGQQPAVPAVMPSNLAGARNVGARTGPAWAGPKPITDIFSR